MADVGQTLTRIEARDAFDVLLDRFRTFEIVKPPSHRLGLVFQGYTDLSIRAIG